MFAYSNAADLNPDFKIDLLDFVVFVDDWLCVGHDCTGDMDDDDDTDLVDFSEFFGIW